jgi:uracil-DNA glycosylase
MPEACESTGTTADFLPRRVTLGTLAEAARGCRGCGLYCHAMQAVFGEGPVPSKLMLVGERPGDQEDRAGRPFVGPSGRLLDEALAAAGIGRREVYVTKAVKHFKFELRGKRRIHGKPGWWEVTVCRPWLVEELKLVMPELVVALGATAAQSLMGRDFRLTAHRREVLDSPLGVRVMATVHPSSLLRMPEQEARHKAREGFVGDLREVARRVGG